MQVIGITYFPELTPHAERVVRFHPELEDITKMMAGWVWDWHGAVLLHWLQSAMGAAQCQST